MKNPMTVSVQIGTRCYETALPSWLDADKIAPESRVVLPSFFTRMYAVPDVWRYDVHVDHGEVSVNPHFSPDMTLPNNGLLGFNDWRATNMPNREWPSVVLVLESPHEREYSYLNGNLQPLAPANGRTGMCIQRHIGRLLKGRLDDGSYRFILSNPVPYQASMHFFHHLQLSSGQAVPFCCGRGRSPRTVRDKVWKWIWQVEREAKKHPAHVEFADRLTQYNPAVIINACTGSLCDRASLKSLVQCAIDRWRHEVETPGMLFAVCHPADGINMLAWTDDSRWLIAKPGLVTGSNSSVDPCG